MLEPSAGHTVLPQPAIGVGGIVFNKHQQVLLILRKQAPASGLWSIPGGKLEPGETLPTACVREVKEETGLTVRAKHIVAVVERRLEGFHYVIIDYLAELVNPEDYQATPQSDVADAHWVELAKLNNYPLVEGLAEIILRTSHLLHTGQSGGLYDANNQGSDYILL